MSCPSPSQMFTISNLEGLQDVIQLLHDAILFRQPLLILFQSSIMPVQSIFVAFISSFEPLESCLNDWVDGGGVVDRIVSFGPLITSLLE